MKCSKWRFDSDILSLSGTIWPCCLMELPDIINVIESAFRKFCLCWISVIHRRENKFVGIRPGDCGNIQLICGSRSSFDGKYVVIWLVTKLPVISVEPKNHCRIHKITPLGPVLCVLNAFRPVEWPAFGENSFQISFEFRYQNMDYWRKFLRL